MSEPGAPPPFERFPTTRYLGSKRSLLPWLHQALQGLTFETALDAYSGTGAVAWMLKAMGKRVTANDLLRCNLPAGKALVENQRRQVDHETLEMLLAYDGPRGDLVARSFGGIFYTDDENHWIDRVWAGISAMPDSPERSIATWSLFQACIAKRPYNLFHRANLYLRTADVKRGFGNKATWDRPFEEHLRRYVTEANQAVIEADPGCRAVAGEAEALSEERFDLVYLDPPYTRRGGVGTDYLDMYHFLEGLIDYDRWEKRILRRYKHRPLDGKGASPWCRRDGVRGAFRRVLAAFRRSILAISYRSDGEPGIDELLSWLGDLGKRILLVEEVRKTYVLSTNRRSREVLILAE